MDEMEEIETKVKPGETLLESTRLKTAGDYQHLNGRVITPDQAAVDNFKRHLASPPSAQPAPPEPPPPPLPSSPSRDEVLSWHDMYMAGEQITLIIKTAQLEDPLKLYDLFREHGLPFATPNQRSPKRPKKSGNGRQTLILDKEARQLYKRYLAGERASELARQKQVHLSTLYLAFKRLDLPLLGENHKSQQKNSPKPKKQPPQTKLETKSPLPPATTEATLSDIPFPAPLGEGVHIPFDTQTPPLHQGLHIPYTLPAPQAQQLQQLKESLEALGCEVTISVHIKAVVKVEL